MTKFYKSKVKDLVKETAACTIPSIVRGLFIPIGIAFAFLQSETVLNNALYAAAVLGGICLTLAFWASFNIKDGFHRNLNYLEE